MSKTVWSLLCFLLAVLIAHQVAGQYLEYEENEEEEGEEGDSDVTVAPSTTTTKRYKLKEINYNMSFIDQFRDLIAHETETTQSTLNSNSTNSNSTSIPAIFPPKKPTTPNPSRAQEVGVSVNNLLSNVGKFNIPGIVDNALSIREDNGAVRKLVKGILDSIFCSPLLVSLSNCGKSVTDQNKQEVKNVTVSTPTTKRPKPRRRRTTTLSTIYTNSSTTQRTLNTTKVR